MSLTSRNLSFPCNFKSLFLPKKAKRRRKGLVLQINGDKIYKNAKVFYEDGMLIMYNPKQNINKTDYYNWDEIDSMTYR